MRRCILYPHHFLFVGEYLAVTQQDIEIYLQEPLGVDRPQYQVILGVPFPKAALSSADLLRVESAGCELPRQTRTTLRWPDASVRWVLLGFQRDLPAEEDGRCALLFGAGIKAEKTEGGFQLSTGTRVS